MSRAPKVCKDEVENFFKDRGHEVPLELWTTEDKNDDGIISFDEFTGPKGLDEANPVKQVASDDAAQYFFTPNKVAFVLLLLF
tara:strand:+ start:327 stop:575 length:249 start_codon:yes stop_codon:yes gene_type:complete